MNMNYWQRPIHGCIQRLCSGLKMGLTDKNPLIEVGHGAGLTEVSRKIYLPL